MKIPQTGSQALQVLQTAEREGRAVKVNKHGDVVLMNKAVAWFEGVRARFNGQEWRAQREVRRHQQVLEAFGTALSRDFQPEGGNIRLAKAYGGVVRDVGAAFRNNFARGELPPSHEIARKVSDSLTRALNVYDNEQHALVTEALREFGQGTPSHAMQEKLDFIANGIEVGGGEARADLQAMRQALEARTEELSKVWANATDHDEARSAQLRDHLRALGHLKAAIEDAVQASREANESSLPEQTTAELWRVVQFAGVDNPAHRIIDAEGGEAMRQLRGSASERRTQSLFQGAGEDQSSENFADAQPLGTGAGVRGSGRRLPAEVIAANRMWARYDDEDAVPDGRTVAEYAEQEISDAESNAYRNRAARRADAALIAHQEQQAEAASQVELSPVVEQEPEAVKAPNPALLPARYLLLNIEDRQHPINQALAATPLQDTMTSAPRVQREFDQLFLQECEANPQLRLQGCEPAQARQLADSIVARFNSPERFEREANALGHGADGDVWAAEDQFTGTQVVLKVAKPNGVQELLNEGRTLARFRGQPGIVQCLGHYPKENVVVLKPYALGAANKPQTLQAFSAAEKGRALAQVHRGLQALHAAHVAHCDVSLKNMLVDARKQVVLSDFGSAKTCDNGRHARPLTEASALEHGDQWLPAGVAPEDLTTEAKLEALKNYLMEDMGVLSPDQAEKALSFEALGNPWEPALMEEALVQDDQRSFLKAVYNMLIGASEELTVPEDAAKRMAALGNLDESTRALAVELLDTTGEVAERFARLPELFAALQGPTPALQTSPPTLV